MVTDPFRSSSAKLSATSRIVIDSASKTNAADPFPSSEASVRASGPAFTAATPPAPPVADNWSTDSSRESAAVPIPLGAEMVRVWDVTLTVPPFPSVMAPLALRKTSSP